VSTPAPTRPSRARRTPRVTGDEREQAILETLERLLAERPFHDISVDDLARGAGISRPTFYFYFASKEAVLLSLVDRMLTQARTDRGDALDHLAEDPAEALRVSIGAFFDTFRAHRDVTLAIQDASVTSADVRAVWSRAMQGWVDEAAGAIEAERKRGAAPKGLPARDLAMALLAMNERMLTATFARQDPYLDESRVLDVIVELWMRAIYAR
jgi:AcrR family transcriptional regulator